MYIFLDESGDLGFDFNKRATSKCFVITLLILKHHDLVRALEKGIERTIKNKIKKRKKKKDPLLELKGSKTSFEVKKYLQRQLENVNFEIFSVILNKARVNELLRKRKPKLYNYISKFILERCRLSEARCTIDLIVDKCKGPGQQKDFNRYLADQLQVLLPTKIPFNIYHNASFANRGLQAVDMFCWGIARKWETNKQDLDWYNCFKEKIKMEELYLPPLEP